MGLAAYWGVLLIHETGHLIAAQRLGCPVYSIELDPIFGITRFGTSGSRLDLCKIAWAGVLAQTAVAAPLVAWVALFGYTRFEALNMLFAILGFFSHATTRWGYRVGNISGLAGAQAQSRRKPRRYR